MKNWLWCIGLAALASTGCSSDAPKHWNALEQCLIGGPLGKDENIFAKLRGVQLAESLSSTAAADKWPDRCATYATELHDALSDSGKPGMIKRALSEQLVCDGECKFPETGHPLPAADKLWEAVERAEFPRAEASGVAKPKAPKSSLGAEDWPVLTAGTLVDRQWAEGGKLWLLMKTEQGYRFCTLEVAKAKCMPVEGASKFHASVNLTLAPDPRHPILAGAVFAEGSGLGPAGFDLGSKKTVPLFGENLVFDGVGFEEMKPETDERPSPDKPPAPPKFDVRRLEGGVERARASLEISARVRGPEVIEDWFVYVERDDDQKPSFVAKKLGEGARLFDGEQIRHPGEFPGPFTVCRSQPGAAVGSYVEPVRMLGKDASGKSKLSAALLEGKTWHPPVSVEIPKQVGQFSDWRCGAGFGGFSWIEQLKDKLTVSELVCKRAACKTEKISWSQPDLKNVLALGYVQNQVLIIYQSVAGDTRHRVAPLAQLPRAQSSLSFENSDFGGVEIGNPVLAASDQTYLLLQEGGLRALLFDGSEAVPVKP